MAEVLIPSVNMVKTEGHPIEPLGELTEIDLGG